MIRNGKGPLITEATTNWRNGPSGQTLKLIELTQCYLVPSLRRPNESEWLFV